MVCVEFLVCVCVGVLCGVVRIFVQQVMGYFVGLVEVVLQWIFVVVIVVCVVVVVVEYVFFYQFVFVFVQVVYGVQLVLCDVVCQWQLVVVGEVFDCQLLQWCLVVGLVLLLVVVYFVGGYVVVCQQVVVYCGGDLGGVCVVIYQVGEQWCGGCCGEQFVWVFVLLVEVDEGVQWFVLYLVQYGCMVCLCVMCEIGCFFVQVGGFVKLGQLLFGGEQQVVEIYWQDCCGVCGGKVVGVIVLVCVEVLVGGCCGVQVVVYFVCWMYVVGGGGFVFQE